MVMCIELVKYKRKSVNCEREANLEVGSIYEYVH